MANIDFQARGLSARQSVINPANVLNFGAVGDNIKDDTAAFVAALAASRNVYVPGGRTYLLSSGLSLLTKQNIFSDGPVAQHDTYNPSGSAHLRFTGTGSACFFSSDTTSYWEHGGFRGLTITCEGTYTNIFDIANSVGVTWERLNASATGNSTGILKSNRTSTSFNSWENRVLNCQLYLPDTSTSYVADHTWSDSMFVGSHMTGGLGTIDRSYGARYVCCQFERSSRSGLTVQKTNTSKSGIASACSFDANTKYGIEIDLTADTTTDYTLYFDIVGNQFRTLAPVGGAPGIADIYFNYAGTNQYKAQGPAANAHLTTVPPFSLDNTKIILSSRLTGNILLGTNSTPVIDGNGLLYPNAGARWIRQGNGSPEGVIAGSPGCIWIRNDGGAATSLYVKESGTSNTGWIGK